MSSVYTLILVLLYAQLYTRHWHSFSPIGVAANPSIAAVACMTAAVTSFMPSSSVTSTSSSVSSTPTASIVSGWHTAIPCATDTPSRILTNAYITNSDTNTPLSCTQKCFFLGFTYMGIEYCKECYCGASLVSDVSAANITDCDMPLISWLNDQA
ncbi:hypothetical protein DFH09DRAFT_1339790 [Mycena vulgaris]|nr:hypothetical protein DFH09DRAFT_1339790 [Mycena vulgaris]